MLLKDALDREFYVGDRLCRIEPVFAAFTKALLLLPIRMQREGFECLVAEGKADSVTLADGSTQYRIRPPLVFVPPDNTQDDDGIDPMSYVTRD